MLCTESGAVFKLKDVSFQLCFIVLSLRLQGFFWWGNLRERDHLRDPDVDKRIILRWIFRRWDEGVWTGSSWLRIGTGGGHL